MDGAPYTALPLNDPVPQRAYSALTRCSAYSRRSSASARTPSHAPSSQGGIAAHIQNKVLTIHMPQRKPPPQQIQRALSHKIKIKARHGAGRPLLAGPPPFCFPATGTLEPGGAPSGSFSRHPSPALLLSTSPPAPMQGLPLLQRTLCSSHRTTSYHRACSRPRAGRSTQRGACRVATWRRPAPLTQRCLPSSWHNS